MTLLSKYFEGDWDKRDGEKRASCSFTLLSLKDNKVEKENKDGYI